MPNTQSADKRMRSDAKKHEKNQAVLSEIHSRYKKLTVLAKTDHEKAKEYARTLVSKLDKAVVHGVIKHRRADNKKARIGKLLSQSR